MLRKACVAGQFYSSNRGGLITEIENCFKSDIGPNKLPEPLKPGSTDRFKGGVVPHAGYYYSGHEAAHTYLRMYELGLPDTVIIIGPCHRSFSDAEIGVYPGDGFETPFGVCDIDTDLASKIAGKRPFKFDENVHCFEHSIEVQLPFLQYIYEKARKQLKIVPLCVADQGLDTALLAAGAISEITGGLFEKKVALIASSDFSHYIPADVARKIDRYAIDEILRLDVEKMYEMIDKYDISMCGYGPITICIESLRKLYDIEPTLLKYGSSGDVRPMPEVVGYAAISFELRQI